MIDSRFAGHATKEQTGACIDEHVLGEIDKGRMDIMAGDESRNAVEIA